MAATGDAQVLREYLVSIGYKIDDKALKDFAGKRKKEDEHLKKTIESFEKFGKVVGAVATELFVGMTEVSKSLTNLFYLSQRTGATASNLQAFSFGFSQVGISAETAQGAIDNFAASLRDNPGRVGLLQAMGINTRQDQTQVFEDTLDRLSKMPFFLGKRFAAQLGIPEEVLFSWQKNRQEIIKYQEERKRIANQAGLTPEQLTAEGKKFNQELGLLEVKLKTLGEVMLVRFMPAAEKIMDVISKIVDGLISADKATDGWSSKILAVVSALGGLKIATSLPGGILRMLGIGSAEGGAVAGVGAGSVLGAAASGVGIGLATKFAIDQEAKKNFSEAASKMADASAGNLNAQLLGAQRYSKQHKDYAAPGYWDTVGNLLFNPSQLDNTLAQAHVGNGSNASATKTTDEILRKVALHNPGNLRHWAGTGSVERFRGKKSIGNFASFDTDEAGLSAMAALLHGKTYFGSGIDTVQGILNKYAPGSENDTGAYIKDVAKRVGVGESEHLNLNDPSTLSALVKAMIHHEQGFDPYRDSLIQRAVDSRLGTSSGNKVVMSQQTTIHVEGNKDPQKTGDAVAKNQERVNGNLLRNMSGVIG